MCRFQQRGKAPRGRDDEEARGNCARPVSQCCHSLGFRNSRLSMNLGGNLKSSRVRIAWGSSWSLWARMKKITRLTNFHTSCLCQSPMIQRGRSCHKAMRRKKKFQSGKKIKHEARVGWRQTVVFDSGLVLHSSKIILFKRQGCSTLFPFDKKFSKKNLWFSCFAPFVSCHKNALTSNQ